MNEMKVGVGLFLKDKISQGFQKAGAEGKKFGDGLMSVSSKVDKALSGVAGTLATIGVSMGAAATINKTIDFEDKLTRLGTTAGASAEEIKQLKKDIFDAAMLPDIKMNPDELVSAMDVIMTKTGNLDFAKSNIENMGRAMQALSIGGDDVGGMFAEFDKLGYKADEISVLLDTMYAQGNKGAFTAAEFAKNGSAIISAYSKIGTSSKDIANANAAMQILTMGTKDPTAAVTVLENLMQELADPKKQEEIAKLGKAVGMDLNVRDANGQFRDLTELLPKIVEADKKLQKKDIYDSFGTILGGTAIKGIDAFKTYGDKLEGLLNLGDVTGAASKASAQNAATLKSNIQNLQTAFTAFANANLEKPLTAVTDALNKMAQNPEDIKKFFKYLTWGLGSVVAVKGLVKVVGAVGKLSSFIKNRQTGSGSSIASASTATSGAAQVFVTNWPDGFGAARNTGNPAAGSQNGKRDKLTGRQKAGVAGAAALTTALYSIPSMLSELSDINNDESLKGKEKSKAQGGAVGEAVGKIGGAAGGTLAGAAIGSFVPVVGTAIGALVGGGIGMFGGWLGRKAGEVIGEAVGTDAEIPASEAVKEEIESAEKLPQTPPKATVEGTVAYEEHIYMHAEGFEVKRKQVKNTTPFAFNTGNVKEARAVAY